ncbi:FKBP-type peptidyl-prolyl cis-trans isomerase [Limibacter armeniacum]|uniref:FKBP-type peptidyl-prolyl cis-trans isomerase n=1 Tax=Limibacter armeniacum TaxID=466084 RepID=UPI002FE64754
MKAKENHVLTICYELREDTAQGPLLEVMNVKYPFIFLFGTGSLLPAFEANLEGLEEGEQFEFTLEVEEAYGHPNELNIVDVPISAFYIDGKLANDLLQTGTPVSINDDSGQLHHGKVVSHSNSTVKVDFNHAMAGKRLHFFGQVLKIRKATADEIVRKHYIPDDIR